MFEGFALSYIYFYKYYIVDNIFIFEINLFKIFKELFNVLVSVVYVQCFFVNYEFLETTMLSLMK